MRTNVSVKRRHLLFSFSGDNRAESGFAPGNPRSIFDLTPYGVNWYSKSVQHVPFWPIVRIEVGPGTSACYGVADQTGPLLRMQNQFNDYQLGYLDEASYRLMCNMRHRFFQ